MSQHFEGLENRTLFSVTIPAPILQAGLQVTSDASALRTQYRADVVDANAGLKAIVADLKTQPKSRASSLALIKLKAAFSIANAKNSVALSRYLAAGAADLVRLRSAYVADLKKPTTANAARLSRAITALQDTTTLQDKLLTTGATGDTNIDAALTLLEAANPTDTNLQTLVNSDETGGASVYTAFSDQCNTINNDITNLVNLISA